MKKKIITMIVALGIACLVSLGFKTKVYASEDTFKAGEGEVYIALDGDSSELNQTEGSNESSTEASSEEKEEPSETTTESSSAAEDDASKYFEITQEQIDKIIAAAKSGNVDEVKNLLIGTIGFTAFTILMALIYLVKLKLKYINESKLLQSATESTDEKIKELALQIQSLTGGLNDKLDGVESGVKKYYQALNNEKVEEATKKAEEIAKALDAAISLNQVTSSDESSTESTEQEVSTTTSTKLL